MVNQRKRQRRRLDTLKDVTVVLSAIYMLMNIYGWVADRFYP